MLKEKIKKKIFNANININSTLNNTICTITTLTGNTVFWVSTRVAGFKGARKSTPFAIQQTLNLVATKLKDYNVKYINILIKGLGEVSDIAIKVLNDYGYKILSIVEKTNIPFNGCRPPKKRRL